MDLDAGVHVIELTIVDTFGGSDTAVGVVIVSESTPPEAHFDIDCAGTLGSDTSPVTVEVSPGGSVECELVSTTVAVDHLLSAYAWSADGIPVPNTPPHFRVAVEFGIGSHTIDLVVTDSIGATDSATGTITVRDAEATVDPLARFDIDCAGVIGVENDTIPLSVFPGEVKTCSLMRLVASIRMAAAL